MNKDEANHQDKSRKPAPHISMELKADSARVTNLQMEGSRLILTIEAELSESQVKAEDPVRGQRAAAAETVSMPPIMQGSDTEETPPPESVGTSSTIEDQPKNRKSPESPVFSLPDAVAAGVDDEGELASEAIEERILEEVFSVGADKDTVETLNPLSFSGGSVAPSSYGSRPPEVEAENKSSDPLHVFAEAPAGISPEESHKPAMEETTVAVHPTIDDSISYERLEDEIRKVKGRETSVQYKRPYSEDVAGADKVTDKSSLLPDRQADDTVPLPSPAAVCAVNEIDEEEDTLAAIKPDAYSEVLAAEQSEKARVERDHFNTETGPLPFYAAHMPAADHGSEHSEDLDTATQQISYQNMSEQDKDATYNQNSLEEEGEQVVLETQVRSTEHILYEQEQSQEQDAAAPAEPEPAEAAANADSSVFEFDEALAETEQQPEEQPEEPQTADEPVVSDNKVLTVAPEDLDDDIPVLSEESSAFGGERHGEPLPSINFGFDPIPTAQEKPAAEEHPAEIPQEQEPEQEPEPEPEQEQQEQEQEQEQEQAPAEEPPVQPEASESAEPEAELPAEPPPPPSEQQDGENPGLSLNTGEPPRTSAGGTTVLIRYTCPKCKTQGMQAVDKVGTVVNCTNCGKAMRLVMKK